LASVHGPEYRTATEVKLIYKQSAIVMVLMCLMGGVVPAQQTSSPPARALEERDLEQQADAFRSQKDYVHALEFYDRALRKNPKNALVWNKSGMAELQLARPLKAKRRFERAVKLKKDYAEAVNNLGVIYYQQKNYKKAIEQYKKALAIRDSASFHSNLGAAYFDQKDYKTATQEYLRALQLDPEVFERTSATGISAHVSKPEDRAQYAFMLARLYAQAGDTPHCLNQLRTAMENGYPKLKETVQQDAVFAAVREDPKFGELMQAEVPGIPQ
jgi:tetratricopeptide (TPR) repeat protein